jgi:hypothetical protein
MDERPGCTSNPTGETGDAKSRCFASRLTTVTTLTGKNQQKIYPHQFCVEQPAVKVVTPVTSKILCKNNAVGLTAGGQEGGYSGGDAGACKRATLASDF